MLLCKVKSHIMALSNVSCQKPPLRMEFSWNFRGFPYCQSLFQSDAKCEAIDISLCTDAPFPPKKKYIYSGNPVFSEGRGGGGICTQANWYDSHANNTLLHLTSFWRREFLEVENGGLLLWILIPYQCVTRKETQPVNAEVFPVVAFLYPKSYFPGEEKSTRSQAKRNHREKLLFSCMLF